MIKKILFLFLLLAVLSNLFCQEKSLIDENLYQKAVEYLKSQEIDQSLPFFQKMIDSSQKELWTCQALLVCDREDLLTKSELLSKVSSSRIIVIRRVLESKECFRLCAGLFANKEEAVALAVKAGCDLECGAVSYT
ncbi:MAG: hypothetical protein N2445_06160, partial [Acidobacteria bacterium]|nr:hypothetical protein [Acidobacteriota bacterium]